MYSFYARNTHDIFSRNVIRATLIELFLYDYGKKHTHLFLRMNRSDGVVVATNEVMMMGINKVNHRSAPFPKQYQTSIETYAMEQEQIEWSSQIGHRIHIPRKGE